MGRNRLATGDRSDWLSDVTRMVPKRSWAPILLPGSKPSILLHGPFLLAYDGSLAANRTLRQLARLAALAQGADDYFVGGITGYHRSPAGGGRSCTASPTTWKLPWKPGMARPWT